MKLSFLAVVLFIVFGVNFSSAQTHTVTGKIVAFKKYGVKSVKVSSKKSKTSVFSDALGNFSIACKKNDQLVFSAGGFHTQRLKLKGENKLHVNLVVIQVEAAYKDIVKSGHMTQNDLEYSLEHLLDENNNFDQLANIYDVIQYVYPQAKVVDQNIDPSVTPGDFGATGKQIILDSRGVNSINASQYALLIVDGVVTHDISGVNPIDVKSVKVLMGNKAGHWGVRGGNGAIEITLKYN
ncbi:hypothetical protein GCM10022291_17360 [Postechiella marina]|uniref:TonB-dependent receptor plug domain-containing protein n=1 Tax=Postechiella marina TaxID=943941 RepID=A0ABP8C934_9FLAO